MESGERSWRFAAGVAAVTGACSALVVLEGAPPRLGAPLLALGLALAAVATHARWRRRAARWTALFASTCLAVIAADVALRVTQARDRCNRPLLVFSYKWPRDPAVRRLAANVDTERELMGDLAGTYGDRSVAEPRTVRFVSDRYGFRNDRVPTGPLDVVMLGDSFGMGDGTTQDATWTAHLARAGVEVYNLSHPGSPGQHVLNLAWEAPHLPLRRGTVIVWALFGANDLSDEYPGRATPAARSVLEQLDTLVTSYQRRSPLRLMLFDRPVGPESILVVPGPGGAPVLFYRPYLERISRRTEQLMLDPHYPLLVQSFVFMKRLADTLGVRVLVTVVPSKDEVHAPLLGRARQTPTSFAQLVAPLAAGMGFDVLDLGPPLFAEAAARGDDGQLLYWRDDTHWNVDGHAVAARALLARLTELGLVPARARATK